MKVVPEDLLEHKALPATYLCKLLLVGPLPDESYRAFSGLDQDVRYNPGPGIGELTFIARTGMQMSTLATSADVGVDNAEVETLVPVALFPLEGFTQEQIDAGALDRTPFVVFEVNYKDLTPASHEVVAGGTIGEIRPHDGQITVLELRGLSNQLMQLIVELDSLKCRVKYFGSQHIGTSGDGPKERFPCEYDVDSEWIDGEVTSVSEDDPDLEFTDTGLVQAAQYFAPGVVQMLTGANVGQQKEVEAFAAGVVSLQFPFLHPVEVGDTFRIRRDCSRCFVGHNSCDTFWVELKPLHYRGEPHLPVSDTADLNSPGAGTSTGVNGTGEEG